jgi:hypothetical protein
MPLAMVLVHALTTAGEPAGASSSSDKAAPAAYSA